jgi:hypothetical protein
LKHALHETPQPPQLDAVVVGVSQPSSGFCVQWAKPETHEDGGMTHAAALHWAGACGCT